MEKILKIYIDIEYNEFYQVLALSDFEDLRPRPCPFLLRDYIHKMKGPMKGGAI